jgi:uncharacterized protein (DUF433 family)
MSDLLTLLSTPSGHAQIQSISGTAFMPSPGASKMAIFGGGILPYVMTVPHHGQTESKTFLTYYGVTPDVEPRVQFNLTSDFSNFGYLSERLKHSNDAIRNAVKMDLNIMHGNPVFQNTRIPVYQIIEELADGTSLPNILEGYPSLTSEQIQRGLDFAASMMRIYDDQVSGR